MKLTDEILEKVADTLVVWGNKNAEHMRVLLRQRLKHKSSESNLAQSIQSKEATIKGDVVSLAIDLNDYWMFIDLGVKGLVNKSGKLSGSIPTKTYTNKDYPTGFSFKNTVTPPQMINSLQDFISRKGIPTRLSKQQSTSQVIQDSFAMAESMALAIKMKGIDGTKFYTDTFTDESYRELTDSLSSIIGQDIEFRLITEFKR